MAVGDAAELKANWPAATVDETFADKVIVPGLIDPHVHMGLSSLQYATPLTPPWPMATPDGMVRGEPDGDAFFTRLTEIVAEALRVSAIVYGFHDLVHSGLTRRSGCGDNHPSINYLALFQP